MMSIMLTIIHSRLYFSVRWDYEKVSALTRTAKVRQWPDQVLLHIYIYIYIYIYT